MEFLRVVLVSCTFAIASGKFIGCFQAIESNSADALMLTTTDPLHMTVIKCVQVCKDDGTMYVGLKGGIHCYCGNIYSTGSALCNVQCSGDATQICGDKNAFSVYDTEIPVPGTPVALDFLSQEETSITVIWEPSSELSGKLTNFEVSAVPEFSYNPLVKRGSDKYSVKYTVPPDRWSYNIQNLLPGTEYAVSVKARNEVGYSKAARRNLWTEIGVPETPLDVTITERTASSMTVYLPPAFSSKGPISGYHIVPFDLSSAVKFDPENLVAYEGAQALGLPYYLAANLSHREAESLHRYFTIGDHNNYGGYFNAPLKKEKKYAVIFGVVSSLNGVTKSAYSKFRTDIEPENDGGINVFENVGILEEKFGSESGASEDLDASQRRRAKILGSVIGLLLFALLAVIAVYLFLRFYWFKKKRRARIERQGLTNIAAPELPPRNENGVYTNRDYIDDDGEVDVNVQFSALKDKCWKIPNENLRFATSGDVLGVGRFGDVLKAKVVTSDRGITAALVPYREERGEDLKREFVAELDNMIRLGKLPNAVSLIGISEKEGFIHAAIEHASGPNLRDALRASRTNTKSGGRISQFNEEQLFKLAVGIAHGMQCLSQNRITHKQLAAKVIVLIDGSIPKITQFSLAKYSSERQKGSFMRWQSVESLRHKIYTSTSDVWSFGVVLWEIMSLGGTPYAELRSQDLSEKLSKNTRLPRPYGCSDDLYQTMLQCWELDPDNRPDFAELYGVLQTMGSEKNHMTLNWHQKFYYQPVDGTKDNN